MYFFKKIIYTGFFAMIFLSCSEPLKDKKELVAIDSLLDAQVLMLTKQKTSLQKEASIDGKEGKAVLEIKDSASWAQELDVFRQFRLVNSPIYHNKYQIEDGVPDVNSNLHILSITTTEKLPITALKIYYQGTQDKIRKIEGAYTESNSIFSGARNLSLEFQDFQGRLSLTRYRIDGGQKMMLGDSVTYHIEGVIDYQ